FQICNERLCFPQTRWTLPDVTVGVIAGDGKETVTASAARSQGVAATVAQAGSSPPTTAKAGEPQVPYGLPGVDSRSSTPSAPPFVHPAEPTSGSGSITPVSEIAQRAQEGLVPFLIASAVGGLFALVMPCVWPMIPITVNFFVKQGQGGKGKGKATSLAIAY